MKIEILQERLKDIENQIRLIAGDFPARLNDAIKFKNLDSDRKQIIKDINLCKSNDPDVMCSECDCWKHVRHMCS